MTILHLLCAGAVKGLVLALQPRFERESGRHLQARFGAVGAMREALLAGAPCDVFVVTEAMAAELEAAEALRAGSRVQVGRVRTAIAVRAGAATPAIDSAEALRASLLAASALYFPDAALSTAGAHVAAMLDRLGIRAPLAPRLRMFANGATAMRALVDDGDDAALGCTQATEIVATAGLVLVGALSAPFALATVYSAAVAARADDADGAHRLIELLAGTTSAGLRRAGGFDDETASPADAGPVSAERGLG